MGDGMIAVIDYDAGNLESMRLALLHVGGRPEVVRNAEALGRAERIVFPGVGSAPNCMANLRRAGFDKALAAALKAGKPILAVCVGMQLLFDRCLEDGGTDGLSFLPGTVAEFSFPAGGARVKVPHMGWNRVARVEPHPLMPNYGEAFYFVHSYHALPAWREARVPEMLVAGGDAVETAGRVCGVTEYGGSMFASAVGVGSLFGTQFHPERSGAAGLAILERFLAWDGAPC